MLRLVSLVEQLREILRGLPEGWADARLRLTVESEDAANRAAALLGPLNPGRRLNVLRFHAARRGEGPSPVLVEQLLRRLDEERIRGRLELVGTDQPVVEPTVDLATLRSSSSRRIGSNAPRS
jgi:hypothetical protein